MITIPPHIEDYLRQWAGLKTPLEMSIDLKVSASYLVQMANALNISVYSKKLLAEKQEMKVFIEKYGSRKTAGEIARMLGLTTSRVKWHADKMGIELKKYTRGIGKRRKNRPQVAAGYFDETEHETWLI